MTIPVPHPQTFGWIKDALEGSMDAVMSQVVQVERDDDYALLEGAPKSLHQIHGSLLMVELEAAGMLAEDLEALCSNIATTDQAGEKARGLKIFRRGMEALQGYVDAIARQKPVSPLVLVDQINNVRELIGGKEITNFDLFTPPLDLLEIGEMGYNGKPIPPDLRIRLVTQLRKKYRRALLNWLLGSLKGRQSPSSLKKISSLLQHLGKVSSLDVSRQLWWVASGFVDAVGTGELTADARIKSQFARLDEEISRLEENSAANIASDPPDDLLRMMLYFIGRVDEDTSESIGKIKQDLELAKWFGGMDADYEALVDITSRLQQVNAAFAPEDFDAVEILVSESFADFEGDSKGSILDELADKLGVLSTSAQEHEVEPIKQMVDQIVGAVRTVDKSDESIANTHADIKIASALLFLRDIVSNPDSIDVTWNHSIDSHLEELTALVNQTESSRSRVQQVEKIARVEYQHARSAVVLQIRDALSDVESAINRFREEATTEEARSEELSAIGQQLDRIVSAFTIVDVETAAELGGSIQQIISRLPVESSIEPGSETEGAFEHLAFAIAALDVAADNISQKESTAVQLMETASERLAEIRLDTLEEESKTDQDRENEKQQQLVAEQVSHRAGLIASLEQSRHGLDAHDVSSSSSMIKAFTALLDDSQGNNVGAAEVPHSEEISRLSQIGVDVSSQLASGDLRLSVDKEDFLGLLIRQLRELHEMEAGQTVDVEGWEQRYAALLVDETIEQDEPELSGSLFTESAAGAALASATGAAFASSPVETLDSDLKAIFVEEFSNHLDLLRTSGEKISRGFSNDTEVETITDQIENCIHTLAGNCRNLGFDEAARCAETNLELLADITASDEALSTELMDQYQGSIDLLEKTHGQIQESGTYTGELAERLAAFGNQTTESAVDADAAASFLDDPFDEDAPLVLDNTADSSDETTADANEELEQESAVDETDAVDAASETTADIEEAVEKETAADEEPEEEEDIDEEIRQIFLEEAETILGRINDLLVPWRARGADTSTIGGIRREFHTLKGSAAATGYTGVSRLSHNLESLLDAMKPEENLENPQLLSLLEEMHDGLAADLGFMASGSTGKGQIAGLQKLVADYLGSDQSEADEDSAVDEDNGEVVVDDIEDGNNQVALNAEADLETDAEVEPEEETDLETETEAEPEGDLEADAEVDVEEETDLESESEIELESDLEADTEVEAEEETDLETESEVELESDLEADTDVEAEEETDLESESEIELESDLEADTEIEAEEETDLESESEVELESDLEADIEVEAEAEEETDLEIEAESELEGDLEADAEVEPEEETDLETEAESELEGDLEADTEIEAEEETDLETETEAELEDDLELDVEIEAEEETELEIETEAELEDDLELDVEIEAEEETELETETEAELEDDLESGVEVEAEVEAEEDADLESGVEVEAEEDADLEIEGEVAEEETEAPDIAALAAKSAGPALETAAVSNAAVEVDEEIDEEIQEIFLEEAETILGRVNDLLVPWRSEGADANTIGGIRREFHTLKGSAAATGYTGIAGLCHSLESLLNSLKADKNLDDPKLLGLLEEMHDGLSAELGFMPSDQTDHLASMRKKRAIYLGELPEEDGSDDSADVSSAVSTTEEAAVLDNADGFSLGDPTQGSSSDAVAAEAVVDNQSADDNRDADQIDAEQIIEQLTASDDPAQNLYSVNRSAQPDGGLQTSVPATVRFGGNLKSWVPSTSRVETGDIEEEDSGGGSLRIASEKLAELINASGELGLGRTQLQNTLEGTRMDLDLLRASMSSMREGLRELEIEADAQIRARPEEQAVSLDEEFDPLQLDRYSKLQAKSREVTDLLDQLAKVERGLGTRASNLTGALQQQQHIGQQLQSGLMSARMVAAGDYYPRLRYLVRESSRQAGKQVQLEFVGGEISVDRQVIESMMAPFEHMIRNAIAHGIESPADRTAAGKPAQGTIRIELTQQGTELVVEVVDDGRGLDVSKLATRAEQMGLVSEQEQMSEIDMLQVVTQPGFSTAKEISMESGRGVGMDVVYQAVRDLSGSMSLDNKPGQGLSFHFRLPVTLAITQALLIKVGLWQFALRSRTIDRLIRVSGDDIIHEDGQRFLNIDNDRIPLISIRQRLGEPPRDMSGRSIPVVLIRLADRLAGFEVDEFGDAVDIVSKDAGRQLVSVPEFSGVTILGDNTMTMVLDPEVFFDRYRTTFITSDDESVDDAGGELRRVLVVDDSLVVRKVMQRDLEADGLEVETAIDGMNALEVLERVEVDVALVDIEMPRMNGYELLEHLRSDERYQTLPVIIITSRSGDQHRQRALSLGADGYITKPYDITSLDALMRQVVETRQTLH